MESSPETIYIGHLTCLIPDTRDAAIWVSLMPVAGNIDPFPESTLADTGTYTRGEIDSVLTSVHLLSEIGFDKV